MKQLYIFLFLLLSIFVLAQEQYLVVNPLGHRGQIRDLEITNDKKYIITGSFDKTIKKWDIETGEVVQEYRSKIGKGSEGTVNYIKLSPDNKYLAAGGWFGADDESENVGDIRIFDYVTGEIVQVLKGLGSAPLSLQFSADSKSVIAGDIYSKIYRWDISTAKISMTYDYHKFIDNETLLEHDCLNNTMMSIDKKGLLCFWDLNSPAKPLKVDKKTIPEIYKMNLGNLGYAGNVAIAKNLEDYAFSIENYIVLLNKKREAYFMIENKSKPGFIKFSPNGKRLLTGSVARGTEQHAYVFEKQSNGDWKEIADFDEADASMITGDFINDSTVVTAGGAENYIYIWSVNKNEKGKQNLLKTFKTNGFNPYAVGLNNGTIGFADVWTENFGLSTLNKEFDLFLKTIEPAAASKNYTKPVVSYKEWDLTWCRAEKGLDGLTSGLQISKNKVPIDTIKRNEYNGSRHTIYTFAPNGMIITGGDYGHVEAYGTNHKLYNRFVGHTGLMHGLSISSDGKRMISSSDDNTIRIWPLDKLGEFDDGQIPYSFSDYLQKEIKGVNVKKYVQDKITKLKLEKQAALKSIAAWEEIIQAIKKDDPYEIMSSFEMALDDYRCKFIYPIVSIFMTTNGEWIIWNEEGYFSASKKGAQYVGYYLNQGKDKAAKFYPFEQFDLKFNRPDIILKDLALGSDKIRNFYYKAYLKRLEKMGISENQLSGDINIPIIQIKEYNLSADKKQVTLTFFASDKSYGLDRVNVFINDVPVYGRSGIKLNKEQKIERTITFDLTSEKNKIQISVLNEKGVESLKEQIDLYTPKATEKPNLYLISIGTSDYQDQRFSLKYASKDAQDLVNLFKKDQVYANIYQQSLLNQKSTKENIIKLKEFIAKAGRDDVVMVFIAGHGLLDEKFDYYYATYDTDFNNPSSKGLLYSEIEELLDGITALKKLLFMDTCHSGELDKDDTEKDTKSIKTEEDVNFRAVGQGVRKKKGEGLENTSELVKELFTDLRRGTGATIISSAGGVEFALESDTWKNGLFTYCMLQGISEQTADLNKDGQILLSELQLFVRKEVYRLSNGKQSPTSRLENLSMDYLMWTK